MLTITHVLAAVGAAVVWALFLLASPHRRCTWCKGTRRARRYRWVGPTGKCRRCRGRGRHQRLGATVVHAFFWSVLGDRIRDSRRERLSKKEGTQE